MSKQQLNLDLRKHHAPLQVIYGRQGESEIEVDVTITDAGAKPSFEGCKLQFNCTRPDGAFVQTSEGLGGSDTFSYKIPIQATAVPGRLRGAYFAVIKDDDPTYNDTTETFLVVLEKSATFNADPGNYSDRFAEFQTEVEELLKTWKEQQESQSTNYQAALEKMRSDIESAITTAETEARETFTKAEQERQQAFDAGEQGRNDAEALREKNTKKAVSDAKTATTQTKKAATLAEQAATKANEAAQSATEATQAATEAAESITSTVSDIETKEAERQAAELIREENEQTRESNESQRIADHAKHNEQQEANNQAQTSNDESQAQNDLAQAKNNADQAANNQAAYSREVIRLTDGQFDPETRQPTIESPHPGAIYQVPKLDPTSGDNFDDWYPYTDGGETKWERYSSPSVAQSHPIPTDKIDAIISGETQQGDEVLQTTQLSYYDKARKTANDALYATQESVESALGSYVETSTFEDFKKSQTEKDSNQDAAITQAKTDAVTEAGTATTAAIQKAVEAQATKDTQQDDAIKKAQETAEAAAKAVPPLVTKQAPGTVPALPEDASLDKLYAIGSTDEGEAVWCEVKATGGGLNPTELRNTLELAKQMHDTAHTDVQDDPLLHSWQNTQSAIDVLQTAIQAAQAVSDACFQTVFDQTELDRANRALKQAIEVFKQTGTEAIPNYEAYEALKQRVEAVNSSTITSTDGKDVTFGSKYVLTSEKATMDEALETAKSSVEAATKQSQIDAAVSTLTSAVETYESAVKTAAADTSALDAAISAANTAKQDVQVSADGKDLPAGSKYVEDQATLDALTSAIETATSAKTESTTQAQIDAATSALTSATSTFTGKVKQNISIYGVRFDDFPATTKGVRTDGAANFGDVTPALSNGSGSSPFDNIAPWSEMKAEDRTGGRMVKIPKFYYKLEQNGKGVNIQIATDKMEGFTISPAHMDRKDGKGEREAVYVGRYHCATGTYKSTSGVNPANNDTKANMYAACHRVGDNYYMMDFATRFTLWLLYLVEMASWNSQADIGYGTGNSSSVQTMGYTDDLKYCTGTTQADRTTQAIGTQWRNIEGLWDNVFDFLSGCYNDGNGLNIITDTSKLGDSSGGKSVGIPNSGWCAGLTVSNTGGFPAFYNSDTSGGGELVGTCDGWYFNASGPVVCVGGDFNRNADRGMFCVRSTSATNKNANYGCRLLELP